MVAAIFAQLRITTQEWSGPALIDIPDGPCLVDSSAIIIGNLDELDSTIVIYLSYPIWSQVWVVTVLVLLLPMSTVAMSPTYVDVGYV